MTMSEYTDRQDSPQQPDQSPPVGGLYSLPLVGNGAATVRQFYNEIAPKETDSREVRVAKQVFRWSSLVMGTAAVGMMVL